MPDTLSYVVPVEVREAADGPMLRGVILQEGRAAVWRAGGSIRADVRCVAV